MLATLQDLPVELLALICDELGGSELRRRHGPEQRTKLALCRKWYDAARSVYTSGLEVANVNIFGYNLDDLTKGRFSYAASHDKRQLMHKNTRRLRIRVLDHPWDETSAKVIEENSEINTEDEFDDLPSPAHYVGDRWDWARAPDLSSDAQYEAWSAWPATVKSNLDDLASDLRNFSALENLIVEASGTFEIESRGLEANYIAAQTIYCFVSNLPIIHNLSALILDLCGSVLLPSTDGDGHICPVLASMWPRIHTVRIRMRRICPAVFALPDMAALPKDQFRCKSLVLKLHVPAFQAGRDVYDVLPCLSWEGNMNPAKLQNVMVKASQSCLQRVASDYEHNMDLFRISHIYGSGPSISCVDCLTLRTLYLPEEFFSYEDDGTPCWFEHEETLRQGGDYLLGKPKIR